jgi:hypothetical protein
MSHSSLRTRKLLSRLVQWYRSTLVAYQGKPMFSNLGQITALLKMFMVYSVLQANIKTVPSSMSQPHPTKHYVKFIKHSSCKSAAYNQYIWQTVVKYFTIYIIHLHRGQIPCFFSSCSDTMIDAISCSPHPQHVHVTRGRDYDTFRSVELYKCRPRH